MTRPYPPMPCNAWNSVGLGKTTAQIRTGMLQWCWEAHCFPRLKPCPKSRPGPNPPPSRTSCHKLEIDPLSNFLFIRIIKHHQTSWLGLLYSFVDGLNERHGPVWLHRFTSKTVGRKYRTVVNWKYRCFWENLQSIVKFKNRVMLQICGEDRVTNVVRILYFK